VFQERLYDTNCSESLSSLDSLETKDPDHMAPRSQNREPSAAASSSFFTARPGRGQAGEKTIKNGRRQPPDGSGEMFPRAEDRRCRVGLQERSENTEAPPPAGRCALLSLCETIAAADVERDAVLHSDLDSPKQDNVTAVRTNDGSFFLEQEKPPDLGQHGDRGTTAKPPLQTDLFSPGENLAKPREAAREPNVVPSDNRKPDVPGRQMMKDDDSRCAPMEKNWIRDSVNDLNKFSNDTPKAERFKDTRGLRQESSSNLPSDSSRHRGSLTDTAADTDGISSHTVHHVRFVKGILKKQSGYAAAARGPLCGLGKLVSAKQVAISIRDSVELARERSRKPEGGATKAVRKRLRWLDEADLRHQDYDTTTTTAAATTTTGVWKPDQSRDASGLQDNGRFHTRPPELQRGPTTAAISGASSRAAGLSSTTTTTTTPSGASSSSVSHLTRQAWADAGGQAGRGTPRRPNPPSRPAGPQAPRKERPGRAAAAAPVSWRVRKGTLVRPQSATEAGWGGRGPGAGRVPVPPPRGVTGHAPYCAERTFKPTPPLGDQGPRGPSRTGDVPSHTHTIIRTGGDILVTPLPRSYRLSFTEGPPPQALQQESRGAVGAQERGLCLHCTPTEEEISLLWQGVRSALAPTEGNVCLGLGPPKQPSSGPLYGISYLAIAVHVVSGLIMTNPNQDY